MPDPKKFERTLDRFGHYAVEAFHYLALFIIGCMVAWSAAHTVYEILTVKSMLQSMTSYCYLFIWNSAQWSVFILKPIICLYVFLFMWRLQP